MYLRSLHIENLKLVRSLDLSFTKDDGSPRMWTVLVGENGLCKTALLQAIALAAAGHERGNQLVSGRSLSDRRQAGATTTIEAQFGFSHERHELRNYPGIARPPSPPILESRVQVKENESILSASSRYITANPGDPLLNPLSSARGFVEVRDGRERPLPDWFVAGYGVGRGLHVDTGEPPSGDAVLDRFRPLFDPRHKLLGARFASILEDTHGYVRALTHVLVDGKVLPRVSRIELRGRGGVTTAMEMLESNRFEWEAGGSRVKIPATWLSQGYQGTIAWIADLIGQAFFEAWAPFDLSEFEGLVLIDELDLHLHPRWQVDLVPRLKNLFPRLQFVVTTHSPMLLPGFKNDEIVRLCLSDEGDVVRDESRMRSPALMSGSEMFAEFFGIDDLYPTALARDLRRYGLLAANPYRTDDEDVEVLQLRERLEGDGVQPGFNPEPRKPQP